MLDSQNDLYMSIKNKFRSEIHEESIIYVKTSFLWKQLKWILYQSVWVLPCIDRRRVCYGRKMLSSTVRKDLPVYLIKYSKTGPCCTCMVGFMFSEDILVKAIPWPIQSLLVFVLLLVTCHQHWITRYGFPTII